MIVTCQNCDARFSLNDSLIKKTGSKVRCSKCKHVFVVHPEEIPTDEKPVHDQVPETIPVKAAEPSAEAPPPEAVKPRFEDTLAGPDALGEDFDLSEIEKMLNADGPTETAESTMAAPPKAGADEKDLFMDDEPSGTITGELDLSEIEKMLDIEPSAGEPETESGTEPEELVFDLPETPGGIEPRPKSVDDFDLSDIEKMLADEVAEDEAEDTSGLTLSSEDAISSTPDMKLEVGKDGESLDLADLEAFLSTADEKEAGGSSDKSAPAGIDDLDLSDLKMIMETKSPEKIEEGSDEEELDFKLEIDEEDQISVGDNQPKAVEAIEQIDFSDLEGLMETEAKEQALNKEEEEELHFTLGSEDDSLDDGSLKLEMEEEPDAQSVSVDSGELEIRIDGAGQGPTLGEKQRMEAESLDLEFEDEPVKEPAMAAEAIRDEFAPGPAVGSVEEEKEESVSSEPAMATLSTAKKSLKPKRSRTPLIVILGVILFAGAGVLGYLSFGEQVMKWMNEKGVGVPFLSKEKKADTPDVGNLKITTSDIDSQFVKNAAAGRLFVISGKAHNGYGDARSLIRITGKLYGKGKKLVTTETIFSGNVMTIVELSKLTLDDIKKRLENQQGDNGANMNIKPGEDRPFMIVFSNLPENLEEFTLEVTGSVPATGASQK